MDTNFNLDAILNDSFSLMKAKPVILAPLAILAVLSLLSFILTGPILAQLTADYINSTITNPTALPTEFLSSLGPFLIPDLLLGLLGSLFVTGMIVGIKNYNKTGKLTLGAMISGAFSHGFFALAAQIYASIVVFWPMLLYFVFVLMFLYSPTNPAIAGGILLSMLLMLLWAFVGLYWISPKLGKIAGISLALSILFGFLAVISPIFILLLILPLIAFIIMIMIWFILAAITISYIIPTSIVFETKEVVLGAKNAFKFLQKYTAEMGIIAIVLLLIAFLIGLLLMPLQFVLAPTPDTLTLMSSGATADMFFNGNYIILQAISLLLMSVILPVFTLGVLVSLFAYLTGAKKLPAKAKVKKVVAKI